VTETTISEPLAAHPLSRMRNGGLDRRPLLTLTTLLEHRVVHAITDYLQRVGQLLAAISLRRAHRAPLRVVGLGEAVHLCVPRFRHKKRDGEYQGHDHVQSIREHLEGTGVLD